MPVDDVARIKTRNWMLAKQRRVGKYCRLTRKLKQSEITKICATGGSRRLKTEGWGSIPYRSFGILTGITCLPCLR